MKVVRHLKENAEQGKGSSMLLLPSSASDEFVTDPISKGRLLGESSEEGRSS